MKKTFTDKETAAALLPTRVVDGNKGTFGRLLLLVGSEKYKGASLLAVGAALRGGAGYVTLASEREVTESVLAVYPEALFSPIPPLFSLTDTDIKDILLLDAKNSATVIGCGSSVSEGLYRLIIALLKNGKTPLVIDADAINALALHSDEAITAIAASKRRVILTPHPLEFSRISGIPTDTVAREREVCAEELARRAGCTVLLKGHGTVITDGTLTRINTTGSSALAKAGSGDTLAGLLGSLLASGCDTSDAAALAAYIHGAAGDALAARLSSYGVTPSDLPLAMAEELLRLEDFREKTQKH